jgi:malate dehydrogenase
MTRDELLRINQNIVTEVTRNIVNHSPNCIIIMVTNPVEAMTYVALQTSQFPRNRVLGLSGVLDGARLSAFITGELKAPVECISSCVLGQHGENMVIIPRLCKVNGKPLTDLLPEETIDRLVQRTVKGGAEIVELLKTGSAFYAPSAAVAKMVDAIILNKKEALHCSAYLDGEYGLKDTIVTVPVKLGKTGIEQIIELKLTDEERQALTKSAEAVRELIRSMKPG